MATNKTVTDPPDDYCETETTYTFGTWADQGRPELFFYWGTDPAAPDRELGALVSADPGPSGMLYLRGAGKYDTEARAYFGFRKPFWTSPATPDGKPA